MKLFLPIWLAAGERQCDWGPQACRCRICPSALTKAPLLAFLKSGRLDLPLLCKCAVQRRLGKAHEKAQKGNASSTFHLLLVSRKWISTTCVHSGAEAGSGRVKVTMNHPPLQPLPPPASWPLACFKLHPWSPSPSSSIKGKVGYNRSSYLTYL